MGGPLCILHVIPIAAMGGRIGVDIGSLYHDYVSFLFSDWGGGSRSTNLDGLIVYPGSDRDGLFAYSQIFRTGALEFVRFGGMTVRSDPIIPSSTVSTFFREAIDRSGTALMRIGVSGPAIVSGAFLNAAGFTLGVDPRIVQWGSQPTADRDHLILPDAWVEDVAAFPEIDSLARPMLDVFWQAFGMLRCLEYSAEGVWKRT